MIKLFFQSVFVLNFEDAPSKTPQNDTNRSELNQLAGGCQAKAASKRIYPNAMVNQPQSTIANRNVLSPVNRSVTRKSKGPNESKRYDDVVDIDGEPAKKKPKNCNVKVPIVPSHVNINQAMTFKPKQIICSSISFRKITNKFNF